MIQQHKIAGVLLAVFSLLTCGCLNLDLRVSHHVHQITTESCRQQLTALLELGPRYSGNTEETMAARQFITQRLTSYGYQVRLEQCDFKVGSTPQANIIAEIAGREEGAGVCELGAHYDTVRNVPGADDNGSGVAGVLEVARVLAGTEFEKTIRFVFFAAEERGLLGSRYHVQKIVEAQEPVLGLLNLEMIGYASYEEGSQDAPIRVPLIASMPYTGDFILVVGNFSSGWLGNAFESAMDRYVPELKYYSANRIGGFFADAARSDHSPYWEAGLTGIMISDTANFRNPHYHRRSDTVSTIDFDFMASVTRAAAATLFKWAGPIAPTP